MEIVLKKLQEIIPYDRKPRKNEKSVNAVAESIRQCGYVAPIIVDEDGVILAGHTRYKDLQKLGREEVQVVVKEGLSEEQKRKYRLLDNKTSELADLDLDLLSSELEGLDFGALDEMLDWGVEVTRCSATRSQGKLYSIFLLVLAPQLSPPSKMAGQHTAWNTIPAMRM